MEETETPETGFSKRRSKKCWLALFLLLLVGSIFLLSFFLEPTAPPQNLVVSNLTDQSATVSWVTPTGQTKGYLIFSEKSSFPLLPFWAPKFRDDVDAQASKMVRYTTHHITLKNLKPQTKYYFRPYAGFRGYGTGSFTTPAALAKMATPKPVYGTVVDILGRPVVGAVVYLKAKDSRSESAVLSTLTNAQGRWQMDLANLRTSEFVNTFTVTKETIEELTVNAGLLGKGKIQTTPNQDAPAPIIVLKK